MVSIFLGSGQIRFSKKLPETFQRTVAEIPISLVNAFSKILEKIVCTKLVHHLESTNSLFLTQAA
jgi:hypothetical protein